MKRYLVVTLCIAVMSAVALANIGRSADPPPPTPAPTLETLQLQVNVLKQRDARLEFCVRALERGKRLPRCRDL